jgi:two-component system KDP operon response regulator KdpE
MNAVKPRILLVNLASRFYRLLDPALDAAGYDRVRSAPGRDALDEIAQYPPDAVVIDLNAPQIDRGDVLRKVRQFYQGPILVLAASDEEAEPIEALDAGASDYVSKPFRVEDLMGRLRVLLRRHRQPRPVATMVRAGDLTIDLDRRLVTRGGRAIRLSPTSYHLLARLAQADGKVVTHRELLTLIWGPGHANDVQYLRVFVGQLRHKIEVDPSAPRLVITQPGIGYRFVADEAV